MLFVAIGILFMLLNVAGVGPFGRWNWEITGDLWKFCVPFVIALLWWIWSDVSGLNKRREMQRMDKRKQDRRAENLAKMGLDTRARRKGNKNG